MTKKKSLVGKVWGGFAGEYKKPPIYIIPKPGGNGIFIDDVMKKFLKKKVRITIEEVE